MTPETRDQLIRENIKLVYKVTHKYVKSYHLDWDDALVTAMEAYDRALQAYDTQQEATKFSTYAWIVMSNALKQETKHTTAEADVDLTKLEAPESDPLKEVEVEQIQQVIDGFVAILKKFNEREAQAFVYFYGLQGNKPVKGRILAEKLNISRQRLSQILLGVTDKFKEYCYAKDLLGGSSSSERG